MQSSKLQIQLWIPFVCVSVLGCLGFRMLGVFGVQSLGFGVFGVQSLWFGVFGVQDAWGVWGSEFRVWGEVFRAWGVWGSEFRF